EGGSRSTPRQEDRGEEGNLLPEPPQERDEGREITDSRYVRTSRKRKRLLNEPETQATTERAGSVSDGHLPSPSLTLPARSPNSFTRRGLLLLARHRGLGLLIVRLLLFRLLLLGLLLFRHWRGNWWFRLNLRGLRRIDSRRNQVQVGQFLAAGARAHPQQ